MQFAVVLIFSGVISHFAHAQITTKVASVSPAEAPGGIPLAVTVELLQGESIEQVYFVHRTFGQSDYTIREMEMLGNVANTVIPAREILPPYLEYYVVIRNRTGLLETHPLSESADPFRTPPNRTEQITIRAPGEGHPEIIFLSPEPVGSLLPEDVVIAVSLLRADTSVVARATRLLLDGRDVSSDAVFSGDLIIYSPSNFGIRLSPGSHTITVRLFNQRGSVHAVSTLVFSVAGDGVITRAAVADFRYGGSMQLESRHERVADQGTWYNRGNLVLTGQTGPWRFRTNIFATSDESAERQPQNRYFAGIESPWAGAGYGDHFPMFPGLILSGKRVRGLSSYIRLGVFNLDLSLGKTSRSVEGRLLRSFSVDSLAVELGRDSLAAYGRIDPQTWGKFSHGTYERDLFVVRPSFGSAESFQIGFTWLKSKDDMSSIRFGTRPQENFVVGTDFIAKAFDNVIELGGQAAFSAYNSDISSGSFTDAYIDSVYPTDARKIKSARDILEKFITVNDNLRPLSFQKLATLAYEVSAGVNAYDNMVKFTYIFRGSDYNSFGQTFLRKDIRGFSITDRVRFPGNQWFGSVGYERLQDNTSETRPATTTFSTVHLALNYFSQSEFPNMNVGYSWFSSTNPLSLTDLEAINEVTHRGFLTLSRDFDFAARHIAALNISVSDRSDKTVRRLNVRNQSYGLSVTTQYGIPLQTTIDVSLNINTLPLAGASRPFDYTTVGFRGRYGVLDERLIFSAGIVPTFGDFERTIVELSTEWIARPGLGVGMLYTFFRNQVAPNDDFWSLRVRYDL
jgi:hypothetical protein